MGSILLVEDDRTLGLSLRIALGTEGHAVTVATTLAEARAVTEARAFDLVLLDLGLPDGDGLDLCRELRDSGDHMPIIALTARTMLQDRVQGLEMGADDYVTKPFDLPELIARIAAQLRRMTWISPTTDKTAVGELTIDFRSGEAWCAGEPVALSALELRLMRYLLDHAGAVVTREQLLTDVWELPAKSKTRTIDTFVYRLRRLIEKDPARPVHLVSLRGAGYKMVTGGGV
ncbi:MAG: response regulator transcription factor [Deltaproteobacteria bacterium]|nr:MAG: response regulator transcription factor [Deltaproteobacteria bacterium]